MILLTISQLSMYRAGVILGYVMYLSITLFTGEFLTNLLCLYLAYFPHKEEDLLKYAWLVPYLPSKETEEEGEQNEDEEDDDGETRSRPPSSIVPPAVRSESTAGGTVNTLGTTATTAVSGGKMSRSGKFSMSNQDQSVLEAFVDMNPSMSFSGPSNPLPPRKLKSARSGKFGGTGSVTGGSEYGGAGQSTGRPSVDIELSGNNAENSKRQLAAAAAGGTAPPVNMSLVSSHK